MLSTVTNKTNLWLADYKRAVYLDQPLACCQLLAQCLLPPMQRGMGLPR